MARIYFNIPQCLHNVRHIGWHTALQRWTTRQIAIVTVLSFVVLVIIFVILETVLLSQPVINKSHHKHVFVKSKGLGPAVHYGIVIDCGSSGSRVFLYFWPPHSGNTKDLLNIQQFMGKDGKPVIKKIKPGLDTFKDNPEAASDYIKPLLQYVSGYIPKEQQKETLLFILATAGMRMISEISQKAIFQNLYKEIPKMFPFVISESNLEVITGKQEGVYAWIAVNYVLHKFDHGADEHPLVAVEIPGNTNKEKKTHIRRRTVGMLDMGGGSMQIAFEITSKYSNIPKHRVAEFNLGCQNNDIDHTYRVYVTTFLGFGANEARERYEEQVLLSKAHQINFATTNISNIPIIQRTHPNISDPCLPVGLTQEVKDAQGHTHFLNGLGDYEACRASLVRLINWNSTVKCEQAPCSMNGVHQPIISFHNSEFYAFSEFWYTMDDVYRIGGIYNNEKFDYEAKKFCSTRWSTLLSWYDEKLFPKADESRFRFQCFKSAWMSTVLHKGLKFPHSYKMLRSVHQINQREVQWTLGALLHRTRYLPLREMNSFENQHSPPPWIKKTRFVDNEYVIVVCFVIVFVAILLYLKHLKICQSKKIEKLHHVPSMSYFMVEEDQIEQGLNYVMISKADLEQ
ncbi:ectonucleoside triphosphate diphosphohydrolase 7-like [Saccostrea echinata]|uniref:ectonucleoside triphosphate diphosphohydrolase 7-like n=1 Tax=Saccostrea echinata TaxID=191078 RepID=UPI002A800B48|nr:ectonucleoside triphosphate diphosphohydrolase 7-like [Saccostrea echinata]